MLVISESEERTTHNASGLAVGLAGPSQGSEQVSTWRVVMRPGTDSPVHEIDRDQVWMPVTGTFEFDVDGGTRRVTAGQAAVVPAGAVRTFRAVDGEAQALVAMAAGGTAGVPGGADRLPLPWAA
jgi:quercetin dioxygenase-like cupin family protein